jgi:hypothetical protein
MRSEIATMKCHSFSSLHRASKLTTISPASILTSQIFSSNSATANSPTSVIDDQTPIFLHNHALSIDINDHELGGLSPTSIKVPPVRAFRISSILERTQETLVET